VKMIEVGTPEELERAINERTAMMFFLNSSDLEGEIHHEEFVETAKKHNVPTLIDAAADVPPVDNLFRFTKIGFDLAGFSGGKGLRGPQSAGLLLGRKDLIAAAKLNTSPNADTLCRTNKVNKEEIIGMLVALEVYLKEDHAAVWTVWMGRCGRISQALEALKDVKTEVFVPPIANAVPHLRVSWDYRARGLTASQMARKLREGKPSIEVSPGSSRQLVIGVWMMEPGEDAIVGERIRAILATT
jgi:D-glucosaminate-6-phosphate ammonia-lyase